MIAKIKNIDSNDIKLRFGRIITQISAQKFHPTFSTAPLLPSIISIILLITPFVLPIFSFLSFPFQLRDSIVLRRNKIQSQLSLVRNLLLSIPPLDPHLSPRKTGTVL